MKITKQHAVKVLEVVSEGLSCGLGQPIPGEMCIEAAVGYALGEDFGDNPKCVDMDVRDIKIYINDSGQFKNNKDRAKCLKALSIAQLGSDQIPDGKFKKTLLKLSNDTVKDKIIDLIKKDEFDAVSDLLAELDRENLGELFETFIDYIKDGQKVFIELVLKALKICKSPGCKYLYLLNKGKK